MELLLIYLIKTSVSLSLFYALHMILLRNETFFEMRRAYFLFAILFSLLLPFLAFSSLTGTMMGIDIPSIMAEEIEVFASGVIAPSNSDDGLVWYMLPIAIAMSGSIICLIRFSLQLKSLCSQLRTQEFKQVGSYRILESADLNMHSFSFFKWIVINTHGIGIAQVNDITAHEKEHVRQFHSFDVLIFELLRICMWWNPIVWLLRKEVLLNLEYLADKGVVRHRQDIKAYQYLLLHASVSNANMPIINNFNVSELQKRIVMMNRHRSSELRCLKYLLFLPIAFVLVQCNADHNLGPIVDSVAEEGIIAEQDMIGEVKQVQAFEDSDVKTIVDKMPAFVGGENAMFEYIRGSIKYPEDAQMKGIQGRVTVRFVVTKTGDVINAKILRGISPECDIEALRVINEMPKWKPGEEKGQAKDVYFTLPILFRLK